MPWFQSMFAAMTSVWRASRFMRQGLPSFWSVQARCPKRDVKKDVKWYQSGDVFLRGSVLILDPWSSAASVWKAPWAPANSAAAGQGSHGARVGAHLKSHLLDPTDGFRAPTNKSNHHIYWLYWFFPTEFHCDSLVIVVIVWYCVDHWSLHANVLFELVGVRKPKKRRFWENRPGPRWI